MSSSASKVKWKRARLAFVIVCTIAVIVLSLSYGLRSSYYLAARLTPKLAELGDAVGGEFRFQTIRAMGFTGIVLGGVEFVPNLDQAHPISMNSVTIYPALLGMFVGDLNASLVEIQGVDAKIDLKSDSADRTWIDQLVQSARNGNVAIGSNLAVSGASKQLPEIACFDCHIEAVYEDYSVDIHAVKQRLTITSRDPATIELDYYPIDVCLNHTSPIDAFAFNAPFDLGGNAPSKLGKSANGDDSAPNDKTITKNDNTPTELGKSANGDDSAPSGKTITKNDDTPTELGKSANGNDSAPSGKAVAQGGNAPASTCFQMRMSGISYADSLYIPALSISNYDTNGVTIRELGLVGAKLAQNDERVILIVDDGKISATIAEDSTFGRFSGDYLFDFSNIEILYAKVANRIGFGIELRDPSKASAKIFGGYDIKQESLGITFEANDFDLAPLFRRASFSDAFRIDSLPVSGKVALTAYDKGKLGKFDFDAKVTSGAITSKVLASDPLTAIDFELRGQLWYNPDRTFSLNDAHARLGKIPVDFSISHVRPVESDQNIFRLHVESAANAEDFIPSLPAGFAPLLSGYKLTGPYTAQLDLAFDENRPDDLALNVDIDLDRVKTEAFDPRSDFSMLKNKSFLVRINAATVPIEIGPKDPNWVGFYDLPRNTAYAFVASEDGKFFSHNGFDIRAIRAGLIANIKAKKFVRGGSTISQQVVKNVFLNHDKTASRKFQEAFLTWQMEQNLTKLMIFELYLNLAHFARDTYGIRAAAQYYFKKNVANLTLRESLFLASILPNPIIFGGQFLEGKLSSSRLNKMINVGNALRQTNRISADEWNAAAPLIKEGKIR